MRAISRTLAMSIGLVGAAVAFVFSALYSLFHVLGRISGITADSSHFFVGLGLTLLAILGAVLVLTAPELSALLLVLATIGFFVIMGWWAIIPAIFLLLAALLAFLNRRRPRQTSPGGAVHA